MMKNGYAGIFPVYYSLNGVPPDFQGCNRVPVAFHCRESAGTGPVVLKVVPVTGAAFSIIIMDLLMCAPLFPHPLLVCI